MKHQVKVFNPIIDIEKEIRNPDKEARIPRGRE